MKRVVHKYGPCLCSGCAVYANMGYWTEDHSKESVENPPDSLVTATLLRCLKHKPKGG